MHKKAYTRMPATSLFASVCARRAVSRSWWFAIGRVDRLWAGHAKMKWGPTLRPAPTAPSGLSWSPSGEPGGHRSHTLRRRLAPQASVRRRSLVWFGGPSWDDPVASVDGLAAFSFRTVVIASGACRRWVAGQPLARTSRCFRIDRDLSSAPSKSRRGRFLSGSSFRSRDEAVMLPESRQTKFTPIRLWKTGISGTVYCRLSNAQNNVTIRAARANPASRPMTGWPWYPPMKAPAIGRMAKAMPADRVLRRVVMAVAWP